MRRLGRPLRFALRQIVLGCNDGRSFVIWVDLAGSQTKTVSRGPRNKAETSTTWLFGTKRSVNYFQPTLFVSCVVFDQTVAFIHLKTSMLLN